MPIVPLLHEPAIPDAWHQVTSPGGYEWWHFDAEDAAGELRMVAIFFHGFAFHPGYLREYGKYLRRPTRNAPPIPADYPCVHFALYRGSEIVGQFTSQFPAEQFSASVDRTEVSIGSNRLNSYEDGSLQIRLSGMPTTSVTRRLTASFRFAPRFKHEPIQRRIFARQWTNADHHWVIANPLCVVTGEIKLQNTATNESENFVLNGQGFHDHNYGTGPIGPGLKRWMRGRILMNDHIAMFHFAQPKNPGYADEIHLLEVEQLGIRDLPVNRFNADWSRKTSALLRYPAWVEAGPLQLVNPKVVDASPYHLRLTYDASLRGESATAFCEIIYPHRLRWPILGRLIERSINNERALGFHASADLLIAGAGRPGSNGETRNLPVDPGLPAPAIKETTPKNMAENKGTGSFFAGENQ